jgi:hypothetical protein
LLIGELGDEPLPSTLEGLVGTGVRQDLEDGDEAVGVVCDLSP